ncbi:MAG: M48 family metallopeptidase [Chlorobium sp.]|nr:MAG: M48 family metallopeptidase [Chlorobium sp.]
MFSSSSAFIEKKAESLTYTVKVSKRAKNARLKMMPHAGLVVVVPSGFTQRKIDSLLQQHEAWIRKAARKIEAHRPEPLPMEENGLPSAIHLRYLSEEWSVSYHTRSSRSVRADHEGMALHVPADPSDREQCRKLLLSWLRLRAGKVLLPRLGEVAEAHGFGFAKAGVRLQHSRWGSCSSRGRITLNTKLLFLPDYLVYYIMVHELCHTVHMNHSRAFWELVKRHDPLCRASNREMNTAWKYVPEWASVQP